MKGEVNRGDRCHAKSTIGNIGNIKIAVTCVIAATTVVDRDIIFGPHRQGNMTRRPNDM